MPVMLITGIQAAGKSSAAQAVAERLDRSVHLRGDVFRKMIVNGRASMGPADPPEEAVRQLRLRYRLAALAADGYAEAGFTVVLQDIVLGGYLTEMVAAIRTRPLYVVVLAPRPAVVGNARPSSTLPAARPPTSPATRARPSCTPTCARTRPRSGCGSTPRSRPWNRRRTSCWRGSGARDRCSALTGWCRR